MPDMDAEGMMPREDDQLAGTPDQLPGTPDEQPGAPEQPASPSYEPAPAGWSWSDAPPAGGFAFPPPPPPPPHAPAEPPRRRGVAVVAAAVAAMVFLAAGVGIGWGLFRSPSTSTPTTTANSLGPPLQLSPSSGSSGGGLDLQAIAAKVEPGVVDVNTYLDTTTFGTQSLAPGPSAQPLGAGTGMVLTSSGEVLTNNHVVEGATSIEVTVPGSSTHYYARVVGVDPTDDVALLQLQGASNLSTVTLGNSSTLHVGDQVVAIGNALGQGGTPTVTQGTVTALGRNITVGGGPGGPEHLQGLIQTDASISPGDSGGPLVNSSGQVVGIITAAQRAVTSQTPSSRVGYAIGTSAAVGIVNDIRAGHASATIIIGQPGFMGVEVRNLDSRTAARLGLGVSNGALVISAFPGTPAARAGVSAGSVITAVDGNRVTSADSLGPIIHAHGPGEQVKLTWVDQAGTHTATLQLISGPAV